MVRTRAHFWILNGKVPEPCLDILRWAMWFETADRHVAKDTLGDNDVWVSTVFLGIDHNFLGNGPPILFETMIFGGSHNESMWRYATWDEAESGHAHVLALAREAYQIADKVAGMAALAVIDYVRGKLQAC